MTLRKPHYSYTKLTCYSCEATLEVAYTVSDIIEVMDVTIIERGNEPCGHGWAEGSQEPDWMLPYLEQTYREEEQAWDEWAKDQGLARRKR